MLFSDLSVECPNEDKSSLLFLWTAGSVALYPVGLPLLILCILYMYNVPKLARSKEDKQVLQEMVVLYQQVLRKTLSSQIASFVGAGFHGHSNEHVVVQRAEVMFVQASRGASSISFDMLSQYLADIGVVGKLEAEVQELMISFDEDGNGTLELPEFLVRTSSSVAISPQTDLYGSPNASAKHALHASGLVRTCHSHLIRVYRPWSRRSCSMPRS